MDIKEARKLDSGFKVFWKDPDNGTCSRYYTIAKIVIVECGDRDAVCITDVDGSYLECSSHELS